MLTFTSSSSDVAKLSLGVSSVRLRRAGDAAQAISVCETMRQIDISKCMGMQQDFRGIVEETGVG